MKLALIQTKQNILYNFPDPRRFSKKEIEAFRTEAENSVLESVEKAAAHGADMIVTTEAINFSGHFSKLDVPYHDLYSVSDRAIEDTCSNIAWKYHVYILAGLIRKEEDENLYNSTVFFDRSGNIIDIYHKIHLAGDENDIFTPGDSLHLVNTEYGRLGFAICWDMQFPETARGLAKEGADMILCPTWGWEWIYGPARAYENGIYVAAAMAIPYWMPIQGLRSPSQVISPEGEILAQASRINPEILYCDLPDIHCPFSRMMRLNGIRLC